MRILIDTDTTGITTVTINDNVTRNITSLAIANAECGGVTLQCTYDIDTDAQIAHAESNSADYKYL